jgi:C4-dicarboxylate transporter DctM subunit
MVMYAVSTNTSVGALFMAGVIPGLVLAFMLGLTTWYRAWKYNYPKEPGQLGRALARPSASRSGACC